MICGLCVPVIEHKDHNLFREVLTLRDRFWLENKRHRQPGEEPPDDLFEQPLAAHLTRPIHVQGQTVLAAGSRVGGVVTDATQSAKVKGRAHVAMRFTSLTPHGGDERYTISTAPVARTAEGTKEKDAIKIGAPAAGGAIIGALVGGKKGALVGTAVGGGAGTAAVLSTRGKEVHLGKGAALTLRLSAPVTIKVRG